jgi:hypothetical protein
MALDELVTRYDFAEIVILHTDPVSSGIAEAWQALRPVLVRDYDAPVRGYEVLGTRDEPIIDLDAPFSAEGYYHGVLGALSEYKRDAFTVHLLVAGGRKAMSIYATLAASLLFGMHDQLWTVLSPKKLVDAQGLFHAPPGTQGVRLVNMPILPNRLLPGVDMDALLADPVAFLARRRDLRADFLSRLTKQERAVVDLLWSHPYATNAMLGEMLGKSDRTIENQLRSVYDKMVGFFDFGERITRKRQALLDVLAGKI